MGADLLIVGLVHDKHAKLNWAAGRRTAQRLPLDTVMARLEEINGDICESGKEARREVNNIITALKEEINEPSYRDATLWEVRGAFIHIRGGTSWGDSPSDGWDAFVNAHHFPEVLNSIGFEVEFVKEDDRV